MRIQFLGAAGGVTGSAYLVETSSSRVLIDFGLFQGGSSADPLNRRRPDFDPAKLDVVLLTHAHLDHSGRMPLLSKKGYTGSIYATDATIELVGILLRDSAFIQEMDAERAARHHGGRVPDDEVPLYSSKDVEKLMPLFKGVAYGESVRVAPGVTARYVDAGHILGSASIELTVDDDSETKTVVFSGDIGPKGAPLLRDPVCFEHADLVVLESTYGDRDHRPMDASIDELREIIKGANTKAGRVLIPSFAVGRTQQLVYYIGEMLRAGELKGTEVVVDSPMATNATELYRRYRPLFDEEAWEIIDKGDSPLSFDTLRFTFDADDSRSLNGEGNGIVIISASGMCTGGRIRHHLRHGLPQKDTHVVFVGFQARGTLGRLLVDGRDEIKMFGRSIPVEAQIHTLGGFSAHAGQTELIEWMQPLAGSKPRVMLTHGEDRPRKELARHLKDRYGLEAKLPGLGDVVEL